MSGEFFNVSYDIWTALAIYAGLAALWNISNSLRLIAMNLKIMVGMYTLQGAAGAGPQEEMKEHMRKTGVKID